MNLGLIFFYRSAKKNSFALRPMEPISLKCSSIQTVDSIELKFGMHIIVYRFTYCVVFGEFKINSFFTGIQKSILIHYGLWSQII